MKLKKNFPLAKITTFHLGGPAKFYLKVQTSEEALAAVITAKENNLPYQVVAGGSNTVFGDKGFDGLVIHFQQKKIGDLGTAGSNRLVVSAGMILSDLVARACSSGLAGLEKLAGIPGCVGGAVAGNAGAYGRSFGDLVEWVEIFDGEKIRKIKSTDCRFDYRRSVFKEKNWLILRVCLKFKKGQAEKLQNEAQTIIKQRWQRYGRHPLCAGSFFKNIEVAKVSKSALKKVNPSKIINHKIPAGYLIGEAVPKRIKVGGISLASYHNNFLINDGTGTTKDLLTLAKKLKTLVHRKFGIVLEEEVGFIL